MNWNALSAIGTTLAAFVGIAGILINANRSKKKLTVTFEAVPKFCIYISNSSLRSVAITKLISSIDNHYFYAETFEGLSEVRLAPADFKTIGVRTSSIYDAYYSNKIDALCNPKDEVVLILSDNFGRKYKLRTGLGIAAFRED